MGNSCLGCLSVPALLRLPRKQFAQAGKSGAIAVIYATIFDLKSKLAEDKHYYAMIRTEHAVWTFEQNRATDSVDLILVCYFAP